MWIYITNYGLPRPILDFPWSSMLLQIGGPKLNSKFCFSFMFFLYTLLDFTRLKFKI